MTKHNAQCTFRSCMPFFLPALKQARHTRTALPNHICTRTTPVLQCTAPYPQDKAAYKGIKRNSDNQSSLMGLHTLDPGAGDLGPLKRYSVARRLAAGLTGPLEHAACECIAQSHMGSMFFFPPGTAQQAAACVAC